MTIEETQNPLVFVDCKTFNHANYIEDAMKGFVMQQTEFPFVVSVMDDASTDGEPEVIKRFLEKEFDMDSAITHETDDRIRVAARHKTNENCIFLVLYLKYNHYSIQKPKWKYFWNWRKNAKYIALCEGDDYWIDPLKLQKQVDFLEGHEECQMCCTDAVISTNNGEQSWKRYVTTCVVPTEDIVCGGGLWLQTVTYMFRIQLTSDHKYPVFCARCHVGDYPLIIWASLNGGVGYLPDVTSVYRYQSPGSWTEKIDQKRIEKRIVGWRSEIDMLKGLDAWSNGKYSDAFRRRIREYLYDYIILSNKGYIKNLVKEFKSELRFLNRKQRIHTFFIWIHKEKWYHRLLKLVS